MNHRFTLFIIILYILSACTSTNHVYVKKIHTENYPTINEVIIVIEYLNIKDDLGNLWDFDENLNLIKQDELFELANKSLINKGYNISNKTLKTSGLITNRNFSVDHYINKEKQQLAIFPPYIIRSVKMDEAEIQNIEILLSELNYPVSNVMIDLRSMIKNNYKSEVSNLKMNPNSAILIIQSFHPRLSIFKNFDLGYSVSSSSNGGYIGLRDSPQSSTLAYLVHLDTGDLIWSNKTNIIKQSNHVKFFNDLPSKSSINPSK